MIIILTILIILILIYIWFNSKEYFKNDSYDIKQQLFRDDMIKHFDEYLQESKDGWNYVLPKEFNEMDKSNIFILDVRRPEDYRKGHIRGSTNIFWLDLMKPENLKKIPMDKEIVIVCYVGHTASQILVLLKLLGYNAKVLKFGMGQSPGMGVPVAGWINYGFETTTD
jgi:rhodanese-related sulfurtransferase